MNAFHLAAACGLALLNTACATMTNTTAQSDPFAWLEDVEGAQALDWVRGQNSRSLGVLEADARFALLKADALKIVNERQRLPTGAVRDGHYWNFWQDETNVRGVWRRSPLAAFAANAPQWETLLDVDALSKAENANWVYKGADCQPGGTRCMLILSDGGKDAATVREFDLTTKQFVANGFVAPEAKSNFAWKDADTLLIATDWGGDTMTESGYPFVVKEWKRGTPLASAREVYRGTKQDIWVAPYDMESEDGTRLIGIVKGKTFYESENYRYVDGAVVPMVLPEKVSLIGLHKGLAILTLQQDWTVNGKAFAKGAVLSMPIGDLTSKTPNPTLLYGPGPRESIEDVAITKDAVLVGGYENVRGRILRFGFDGRGWVESQVPLPPNGAVNFAGASPKESLAFALFQDFLRPSTLYALDSKATSARMVRALPAQFDAAQFVSEQFEAVSKDGTKVPYFVVRGRNAAMNGENPTLLYGYGGFQISMTPGYGPMTGKLWLERGGVYVLANIRGGGEFGPAWHQAGLKLNRQVIYDDFIAVAEDLIARKITTPRRLGIMGGSNGGLLMGVMLTQRPELFHAAVVQVPLLDMLGYADANMLAGASWVAEYGDPRLGEDGKPTHPDEYAFLKKLSPYQNIQPKKLTSVEPFFVTSTKDDRVHPGHARKTAAKLEAAQTPFYYYENIDGGHSAAANLQETARRRALEYTYLAKRLMD
jgi:prolyl oligopeptidase